MKRAGRQHLVFGTKAFTFKPVVTQFHDGSFGEKDFDVINVHPMANLMLGGRRYQLGNFMSKELQLADLIDFGRETWARPKPCVLDEDNAASMFQDEVAWTIHRKRAWVALLSGSHYDEIDFSIQLGKETGTRGVLPSLSQMVQNTLRILRLDRLSSRRACAEWIGRLPDHTRAATFAVKNKDYVAYLADAREVTDRTAGEQIAGKIDLSLPSGRFRVRYFSPVDGTYFGEFMLIGGKPSSIDLLPFRHDLTIRAERRVIAKRSNG